MSTMTVSKAQTSSDKYVKQVSRLVKNDPEMMAAAEVALLELALIDLDRYRPAIVKGVREAQKAHVKKYYRALAKTVLVQEAVRKHEGGEDGDEPHPSGSPQSVHGGGSSAKQKAGGAAVVTAFSVESLAKSITTTADKFIEPITSFLKESSVGKGVYAVANYFGNKAATFQYFARAVREYGPFVGMRMLNAYFRYGGYDVPLQTSSNGTVKTEFGDKVEQGESRSKTRNWAIETLKKRLPNEGARDSGARPPSEGFVIDKNGNILAHGVGRGNDHYLPFSSRHLKKLRKTEGAEYVRRRMLGGITSEDLHAAMMMGVDRITVVSGSGTFSMDITNRSHGMKLEHMQVLSRFNELIGSKKKDFDGYRTALETIQAEFPLHFKFHSPESGKWTERADPVGPKTRIGEEIRNIFDVLTDEDKTFDWGKAEKDVSGSGGWNPDLGGNKNAPNRGSGRTPQSQVDTFSAWDANLPGARQGQSWKSWVSEQVDRGVPREVALRKAANEYNTNVAGIPSSLQKEIREYMSAKQAMSRDVVDPTTRPAAVVRPPEASTQGWEQPAAAKRRLSTVGYDTNKVSDNPSSRRLFETINELDDEQWDIIENNPEVFGLDTNDWDSITKNIKTEFGS